VDAEELDRIIPYGAKRVFDEHKNTAVLFNEKWAMDSFIRKNEKIVLLSSPPR